jgi:flavin-dependent thymidylate synthase
MEMSEDSGRIGRPQVEALDAILGMPLKVLDDGFVRVVDYMGADESIVQAARVSYGRGTRKLHEDRGLIRYLMRHWHTTPFEMCEIKLHVRVPMDCWRQWIRHRSACLAEGTEVYCDLRDDDPASSSTVVKIRIEDLYRRRSRLGHLHIRQLAEDTLRLQHSRIVGVYENGRKPVFAMILEDGKRIEATKDHRFLFANGWSSLADECGLEEHEGMARWNDGVHALYVNGVQTQLVEQTPAVPLERTWWPSTTRTVKHAKLVRIERFEYVGEKQTYDVEVEGPFHNFIANGIVTHNSVNEYSTRYSIAIDASQRTGVGEWRQQSSDNRQGSAGTLDAVQGKMLSDRESELQDFARSIYQERLDLGVAREQARKDLTLSTYTEAYWKVDLHNLLHFLRLRMDGHAQQEIRDYATVIGEQVVAKWCPFAWEAFLDYQFHSVGLTRLEQSVIRLVSGGDKAAALETAKKFGWLEQGEKGLKTNRERSECEAKLTDLGLQVPWA